MSAAAPYPGLRPFHPDEVDVFFGREKQIDQLLERLDRGRLLAVVGVSGSGKSSLVKAGLIPALETGLLASAGARWRVAEMRPGNQPLLRLAQALAADSALGPERGDGPSALGFLLATLRRGPLGLVEALADTPPPEGSRLLLVVDQFEEIFRYHEYGEREEAEAFVALLLAAAERPETPLYLVLTMRSDFLGDCALFEGLPEALNDSQFLTPRMRREERRAAIEGPAGVFGAAIEPVLVNRLLNDMGAEPDHLPRMQHLLMRLWNHCPHQDSGGKVLTIADYEAVGGFEDALSRHADEAFAELDEEGRRIAESLFRTLSERGDDQRDIRRPARLGEVAAVAGVEPARVAEVVEVFRHPDRSFLTPPAGTPLDAETVLDVSHESLIRQWRRLRGWVEEEAASAAIYRRLAETARLWQEGQAGLWGPPDLHVALGWYDRQRPTAAWAERYGGDFETAVKFLDASRAKRHQDEEAERRAMVEAEEQRRVRQRNQLLTLGLVVAAALLLLAFTQWRRADRQRDRARRQAALALGGELVARAQEALQDRPQRSLLLAVEALALERRAKVDNDAPVQALQKALSASGGRTLGRHPGEVEHLAIGPAGRWLATAGNYDSVRLWDLDAWSPGADPRMLPGHGGGVTALAFDRGGRWLATGDGDGEAHLWDLTADDPAAAPRRLVGSQNAITAIALGGGRWLATGGEDGAVRLWDLGNPDPEAEPKRLGDHSDTVAAATFSSDGRWLATASEDNTVALWDLSTAEPGARRIPLLGHRGPVDAAVFTPDGRWLATAGRDNTARLWSLEDPGAAPLVLCGHDGSVVALAVSDDSRWLVTGSSDATARVWQLPALTAGAARLPRAGSRPVVAAAGGPDRCRRLVTDDRGANAVMWDIRDLRPVLSSALTGHRDTVTALALSATRPGSNLRFLATASLDHTVRIWSLTADDPGTTSLQLRGHDGPVTAVAFNPGAPLLYSASADASARAWNLNLEEKTLFSLVLSSALDAIRALAMSTDGHWLVAGSDDNRAYLWDLHHLEPPQLLAGHDSSITAVGLSPDSRWLATTSEDNTIRLWDLSAPPGDARSRVLSGNASSVTSLAFSADSRRLATAGRDGTARIWSLEAADPAAAPTVLCGHRDAVVSLVASADGRWLATTSRDGTGRLWDLAALEPLLPTADRAEPVLAAALDEATCRRQAREGDAIKVQTVAPEAARILAVREDKISAIAFVPATEPAQAGSLVAGDSGGHLLIWRLGGGEAAGEGAAGTVTGEPRSLSVREGEITGIGASADGRWLVVAGKDDTAHLIDLAPPGPPRVLALRDHRDTVIALAFSPDSRWLATGSSDGEARLWDLEAEDPAASPGVLYGHQGAVTAVLFSPHGSWLATGSRDHTVRTWSTYLWSLGEEELAALACEVAGRGLTEAEWDQYLPGQPYRRTCSGDQRKSSRSAFSGEPSS